LKFTRDSYWIKSGTFSLLQNLSNLLFGFGGFYLLVRLLSKSDFGAWALFVTVASICEVARVGFIKYSFIKFWSSETEDLRDYLFSAALVLNVLFALIVAGGALLFGGYLAALWGTPRLQDLFYVYAITTVVLVPFFQFEFLQQALLDFRSVFYSYFIRNGFLFFAIVGGYFNLYELSLISLVWAHLIGALLGMISSYFLTSRYLYFHYRISWEWVLRLFHYGKYVVGTSLSSMLYSAVDQFMLGSIVSTASVAIYNATGRITNLINIPSMTLTTVLFPRSAKLIHAEGKGAVKELYEKSVGAILGIVLPAILFVGLFPGWVITIIAGDAYLDSVPILKVTIMLSLLMPFSYQFGTILDSIGKPQINFYATSISFVINATLNYFLISAYGIMGAVWGTLGVAVLGFVVMQVILNSQLGTSPFSVFKHTVRFYIELVNAAKGFLLKSR
jgi:lipopolysaccharide exporter